jgi:hypothetical protein
MDEKQEIEHYRSRIKEMLRSVPSSVNGGSYDHAVAFKKLAGQACKLADNKSAKLLDLTNTYRQLSSYY